MQGIAFELLNLTGLLIDVREQPAGGFAVETGGGNERVTALDFFGSAPGVELNPVIPALGWWIAGKLCSRRTPHVA